MPNIGPLEIVIVLVIVVVLIEFLDVNLRTDQDRFFSRVAPAWVRIQGPNKL